MQFCEVTSGLRDKVMLFIDYKKSKYHQIACVGNKTPQKIDKVKRVYIRENLIKFSKDLKLIY